MGTILGSHNDFKDNDGDGGGFSEEKRSPLKGLPQTLKRIWGLNYQTHHKLKMMMLD